MHFRAQPDCVINSKPTGRVITIRRRIRGAFKGLLGVISPLGQNSTGRAQGHSIATSSTSREVLQSFLAVNNILFSIAEAIPVIGSSIKGAMEAISKVLTLIELGVHQRKIQVQEDAEELLGRVVSLVEHLGDLPKSDALLQQRVISQLQATFESLEGLLSKKRLRYDAIAASIAQCNSRINQYLLDYNTIAVARLELSLRANVLTVESITLVDPLGFEQTFPRPQKPDISFVAQWVLGYYDPNPHLQLLLKGYLDRGNFELTLDDGFKSITVQPELLPHMKGGTKLVMSVVTFQRAPPQPKSVPCPSCSSSIPILVSTESGTQERVFCPHCDRRVQAETTVNPSPAELGDSEASGDCSYYLRNIVVKLRRDSPTEGILAPPDSKVPRDSLTKGTSCSPNSLRLFNNATQRLFGNRLKPVCYVWETSDPDNPWCAEARLLQGDEVLYKSPQSSARSKRAAKCSATNTAYQTLLALYPSVDLANV